MSELQPGERYRVTFRHSALFEERNTHLGEVTILRKADQYGNYVVRYDDGRQHNFSYHWLQPIPALEQLAKEAE